MNTLGKHVVAGCAAVGLAVLAGCAGYPQRADNAVRVGTYNIRYESDVPNTDDCWPERRGDFVDFVRRLDLDVFGMQEVCPGQMADLRRMLPEFEFVGDHRLADRVSGEATPVCYRKSRFDAEKAGTFWLSETPDVPGSGSWKTACVRVCSYLVLKDRATGARFCFANTHADHVSAEAREKGMLLIIRRMKEFGRGCPIVFTGDHNCAENEAPAKSVAKILKNALYVAETPPQGCWRTWNGWRWRDPEFPAVEALKMPVDARNADWGTTFYERCGGPRIDYVYVSDGVRVLECATHSDARPGLKTYPSDHFPVTATVVFPVR